MGVVRLLVAVTDVDKIPEFVDIVVGDGLYEIFLKIDKVCKDRVWSDFYYPSNKNAEDESEFKDEDYDRLDGQHTNRDATTKDVVMDNVSSNSVDDPPNVKQALQLIREFSKTDMVHKSPIAAMLPQAYVSSVFSDQEPITTLGAAGTEGGDPIAG